MKIEVIYTFEQTRPQEVTQQVETVQSPRPPSEAQFLWCVLNILTEDQRTRLRKISACYYWEGQDDDACEWLNENNGKYFGA